MLTTLISTFGVIVPSALLLLLKYLIDQYSIRNKAFSDTISEILKNSILVPFHQTIGLQLYKKLIISKNGVLNPNEIQLSDTVIALTELQETIDSNFELLSYVDEPFLYSLNDFLNSYNDSKQTLEEVEQKYQAFSANYFILLNKIRKGQSLSPRKDDYRKTYYLFKQSSPKDFEIHRSVTKNIRIFVFSVLILPCIALMAAAIWNVALSFFTLILEFKNIL